MTTNMPAETGREVFSRVAFSFESLTYAAQLLRSRPHPDIGTSNALVDSFVVHARRLVNFLHPINPYDDDLLVTHLVKDPPNFQLGQTLADLPRINRRVLHLTLETDPDPVEWQVSTMYAEIAQAMEDLVAQMDREGSDSVARFREALTRQPIFQKVIVY
jgi:hypothetical protein